MSEWPERLKELTLNWMSRQWNEPSRTDYYLMRIAQRVQQHWSKNPISVREQKLQFQTPYSLEERVARSKATWIGGVESAQARLRKQHGNRT